MNSPKQVIKYSKEDSDNNSSYKECLEISSWPTGASIIDSGWHTSNESNGEH